MKSKWETYKGKPYLHCDYTNLDAEGLKAEVAEVEAAIVQYPQKPIVILLDVRGSVISPVALQVYKDTSFSMRNHITRTAVLGVDGTARRMMLEAVVKISGLNIVAFDDRQTALDWLMASS